MRTRVTTVVGARTASCAERRIEGESRDAQVVQARSRWRWVVRALVLLLAIAAALYAWTQLSPWPSTFAIRTVFDAGGRTIARKLARRSFHILRELGPAALEPIPTA